jgi:membrane protease YdiL (CAAX protease family)
MSRIPKLIIVTIINLSFVGLLAVLISKTLGPSHFAALLAYVPRPLLLAVTVAIFYTISLVKVPSFLGLYKKFFRSFLIGTVLSIPGALMILFLLYIKKLPFAFNTEEAVWHFIFIFIGVALFEEGLFRGLIFRQLLTTMPWWRAGLYTGGVFALTHFGNLMLGSSLPMVLFQLADCLFASLLWGYLTWKLNGNIWACVAYHTVNNFYAATFISDQHIRQYITSFHLLGFVGLGISFAVAWILFRGKSVPEPALGAREMGNY